MKTLLRTVVLGMAMAGLAGCNSLSSDAFQTMKLAITGPESVLSVERVNAVDAPVLLAQFGAAEAMLVSNSRSAGLVEWYGVTEMLLTHNGRVSQSAGLPTDTISPLVTADPFLYGLHTVADGLEVIRLVDYPTLYRTGLRQHARYQRGAMEKITFMGQSHDLLRIDEKINMPEIGFKATNHYWVEPDSGLVRRSTQYIAPDLPPLHLTLAKTAGGKP